MLEKYVGVNKLREKSSYFFAFTISKSSVFFVPLILAEYMAANEYGKIEYALGGLGFIINSLLGFGVPSSYAYFVLTKGEENVQNGYNFYLLLLTLYFFGVITLYPFLPDHIFLSLLISYVLANQVYFSYLNKAHKKVYKAIFFDSAIYFVFLSVLLLNVFDDKVDVSSFILPIMVYCVVYAIFSIWKNKKTNFLEALNNFRKIASYSVYLLISSFLVLLILNSGRFLLEFFSEDFRDIGIFGYYLRVTGISLVLFQLFFVIYFRDFYTDELKVLDKKFSIFLGVILFYSIISIVLLPLVLINFSEFFEQTISENNLLFLCLTFFSFYWVCYNIFSNIIIRFNYTKEFNYILLFLCFIFIAILMIIPRLSLEVFVVVQTFAGLALVLSQQFFLYKKGIFLKKSIMVILGAFFVCMIWLLYNS